MDSYLEDIPYGEPLGPQGALAPPGTPRGRRGSSRRRQTEEFYGREHVKAHQGQFGGMQEEGAGGSDTE